MRQLRLACARVVLTLAATSIAVAGCGGGATSSSPTSAPVQTSVPQPSAPPQTSAPQPSATASETTVRVQLDQFSIQLPQRSLDPASYKFAPGTYTFMVSNDGTIPHALVIEDSNGSEQATANLAAGQSTDLTVTLQPDTDYKVYCPVSNHNSLGMSTTITVSG